MDRLTTRNSEGAAVLKTPYQCDRCGEEIYRLADYGNGEPIEELCRLEELKEQGRLPELACAVGDAIYLPDKFWRRPCKYIIKGIEINSNEIYFIDSSGGVHIADDFGRKIFLTQEEAEEELKRRDIANEID